MNIFSKYIEKAIEEQTKTIKNGGKLNGNGSRKKDEN